MTAPPNTRACYLGTPGRMVELPCPSEGWSDKHEKFGALNRALSGRARHDVFGFANTYTLEFPYCTEAETAWLELCYLDAVGGPLWFIDPNTRNRLPRNVAATGSVPTSSLANFVVDTAGSVRSTASDFTGDPHAPGRVLAAANTSTVTTAPVPCVPGETLTGQAFVNAPSTVTAALVFTDAAGNPAGRVDGVSVASSGTYVPVAVTGVVPTTAAMVAVRVTVPTAASVGVAELKLAAADAVSAWTPGGGAVRVSMTEKPSTTPLFGLATVTATLVEL